MNTLSTLKAERARLQRIKNPNNRPGAYTAIIDEAIRLIEAGADVLHSYPGDLVDHGKKAVIEHQPPSMLWILRDMGCDWAMPTALDRDMVDAYQQYHASQRWYIWDRQQLFPCQDHTQAVAHWQQIVRNEAARGEQRWRKAPIKPGTTITVPARFNGYSWTETQHFIIPKEPELAPVGCTCDWCKRKGYTHSHWTYRAIKADQYKPNNIPWILSNLAWEWIPDHDIIRHYNEDWSVNCHEYRPGFAAARG